jgi:hypothetical protein
MATTVCERKRGYLSEGAAQQAADEFSRRPDVRPLEPYPCDTCHQWHLRTKKGS